MVANELQTPDPESIEAMAARLKQKREERGLSIEQAASEIGVSPDEWLNWESAIDEPLATPGVRAARLLGVTANWLAMGTP